jgi:hypothetical protein
MTPTISSGVIISADSAAALGYGPQPYKEPLYVEEVSD